MTALEMATQARLIQMATQALLAAAMLERLMAMAGRPCPFSLTAAHLLSTEVSF